MLTGVILAGGKNSRMHGLNKALLTYKGEHFIERQIHEMSSICSEMIVVTNDASVYTSRAKPDMIYTPDIFQGSGPLGGFHAAFSTLANDYVWVVGCDIPKLSAKAASKMLTVLTNSDYDAVLPVVGGKHQMLHGIYRPKRLLPLITERLEAKQYRLSGLLDSIHWLGLKELDWMEAGLSMDFTEDVDTPLQYLELLQEEKRTDSDVTRPV
ncbi:molybdenum cofactor guanylyltransferase [Paenibacillus antibioticophila]|uniref:Molybdenum cofactor guanylyltransferase n=1 Tax=Paenibacillus antibioticophila TaxID=1274374 RepID=A0A919XW03_9BACL|nr:molybdenum cofactor guanylyltransferase [Paenibacillus antibioticophila]GIO37488.1 molybdenum cofactor guanylyltransferase [Paenibacillus antibioticophila]